MASLKDQLRNCQLTQKSARPIFRRYGMSLEEDASTPLIHLNSQQAMSRVLKWIAWNLETGRSTEIRLTDPKTKEVYTVLVKSIPRKGLRIKTLTEPKLFGKVLHLWNTYVTYETLSLFEIKASTECADALNSLNDDIMDRKIDDLVTEAIALDLPMYDENILDRMCEKCGVPDLKLIC